MGAKNTPLPHFDIDFELVHFTARPRRGNLVLDDRLLGNFLSGCFQPFHGLFQYFLRRVFSYAPGKPFARQLNCYHSPRLSLPGCNPLVSSLLTGLTCVWAQGQLFSVFSLSKASSQPSPFCATLWTAVTWFLLFSFVLRPTPTSEGRLCCARCFPTAFARTLTSEKSYCASPRKKWSGKRAQAIVPGQGGQTGGARCCSIGSTRHVTKAQTRDLEKKERKRKERKLKHTQQITTTQN